MSCRYCGKPIARKSKMGPPPRQCDGCKISREAERSRKKSRAQYWADVDGMRERARRYAAEARQDPERFERLLRRQHKRRCAQYGLTVDGHAALLSVQGGGCAICGEVDGDSLGRGLSIDHCHETGTVRGLLCANCNNGLGRFKDNPTLLSRASSYLQKAQ